MVGASFYAAGFTVMTLAGAIGIGPRGQKIFGALMLALGSISVASALLITALAQLRLAASGRRRTTGAGSPGGGSTRGA